MKEIWKQSILENYEVSNFGRIRNKKTLHIMKTEFEEKGYCRLRVKRKHYAVHRLVALAFIPNPENKPQVDHINMKKSDNNILNLRWCSNLENQRWRWGKETK